VTDDEDTRELLHLGSRFCKLCRSYLDKTPAEHSVLSESASVLSESAWIENCSGHYWAPCSPEMFLIMKVMGE